jgi:protein SCO1
MGEENSMKAENTTRAESTIKLKKGFILFTILFLPGIVYLIFSTGRVHFKHLPIYGEREGVNKTIVDGKERIDTIYHTIPAFSFTNQDGKTVTDKTFEGKIYVANFFFTTCKTICPKMSSGIQQVQERLKEFPDLLFISHTVNPQYDTVEALKAYAQMVHGNTATWHFVTGDKKAIYDMGIHGYLLPVGEDVAAEGGFLHSEQLVLVDKEKRIRGFYDGTSVKAITDLIDDIKTLAAEYAQEKNNVTVGHP